MMLHHPFWVVNNLLNLDSVNLEGESDNDVDNQVEAYTCCQLNHSSYKSDSLLREIQIPNNNEFKEASDIGDLNDSPQASWQALAAELPNRRSDRVEDPNLLSYRDIDQAYNQYLIQISIQSSTATSRIVKRQLILLN